MGAALQLVRINKKKKEICLYYNNSTMNEFANLVSSNITK